MHPCTAPVPGSATSIGCCGGHLNTSCPMNPSPFKHLASLGSLQYSLAFGYFLSPIQTSAVTSVPATALAQQLWNYACRPPGHHLKPCHLCLFISCQVSCQFLPHQFLSWDRFSPYFSIVPAIRNWSDGENETHSATFCPQLSVLKDSYTTCEPLQLLSTPSVRLFLICITETHF